jgi:glycosyltransferase involved in cell wall biosynthesis
MMDELKAFSLKTNYDLVLLRKPDEFYEDGLDDLRTNGVTIFIQPKSYSNFMQKVFFTAKFFLVNLNKLKLNYNGVMGIKSMFWMLSLDLRIFDENSNIHCQFATQPSIIALMIQEYFNGRPVISFTFHAYDIYFKNAWFNKLLKRSHRAFSISEFNMKYVENNYMPSDNVKLSRLGVFREKIELKEKHENSKFRLGLISWFVEKKGIKYLIEAMNILVKSGHNEIELILAGDGPLKDEILALIKKYDLSLNIKYIGKIKGEQKEEFFRSLDTFILPSINLGTDQDGIPVVLMEAVAYGLPVISTDISGIPEICIHEYNGLLIKERCVECIEEAILILMKNRNVRMEYSKNSLEVSNQYDIKQNSNNKLMMMNWEENLN